MMKRIISILLLSVMVASAGCSEAQVYQEQMIWDVYSDYSSRDSEQFLTLIEGRPTEHRLLLEVKKDARQAFDEFMLAMKSALPGEDGEKVEYLPACFHVFDSDEPLTSSRLWEWYDSKEDAVLPLEPPHSFFADFFDLLSQTGKTAQAWGTFVEGSQFESSFGSYQNFVGYFPEISNRMKFARIAVRGIEIPDEVTAICSIDLLGFKNQTGASGVWSFERVPLRYILKLREDGLWELQEQL